MAARLLKRAVLAIAVFCAFAAQGMVRAEDLSLAERLLVQERLIDLGHLDGAADGVFGPMTRAAIGAYQTALGRTETGNLSGEEVSTLLAPLPLEDFDLLDNTDLVGADYRSGMSDPNLKDIGLGACQARCASETRCTAFTYNVGARVCFLKYDALGRSAFPGAVSGNRLASGLAAGAGDAAVAAFDRLENVDLPYNDFRSGMLEPALKGIDLDACEAQCADDGRCGAYTYNSQARVCFLKSAAAEPVGFSGAYSGIKRAATVSSVADLWVRDPSRLMDWARETIARYAPETPPLRFDSPIGELAHRSIPGLDQDQAYDLSALAGEVTIVSPGQGNWAITRRMGENFEHLETDRLVLGGRYRDWLATTAAWRASYSDQSRSEVGAFAPQLEALIAELDSRHGEGNPLSGFVKLDLALALGQLYDARWEKERRDTHLERTDRLKREAFSAMARVYSGAPELARILHLRAVAAITSGLPDGGYCKDREASMAYSAGAELLAMADAGDLWVGNALADAAGCAEGEERVALFEQAAPLLRESDSQYAGVLMQLGVARAQAGDPEGAKAAILNAMALDRGQAYASAYGWMHNWFDHFDLVQDLGLEDEVDLMFAHRFVQALSDGPQSNRAEMSSYFGTARELERLGRFEVADMFYAAIAGAWDGDPTTPAKLITAQAINDRDYAEAEAMAARLLALTPPGSNAALRVDFLSMLAQAAQLAGEFERSADYAQQALVEIGSANLGQDPKFAEAVRVLEGQITAALQASGSGRHIDAAIDDFSRRLEEACTTGYAVPELPETFVSQELGRSLFFHELAGRYAHCAHAQFDRRFMVEQDFGSVDVTGIESYFRTLVALGQTEQAWTDFARILAVEPEPREREEHDGWAIRRNLERLNAATRAAILEGDNGFASRLAQAVIGHVEAVLNHLIALDMAHDEVAASILMLKTLGEEDRFIRLATIVDKNREEREMGYSCYGVVCDLAIELRQSRGDLAGVEDYSERLNNGLILFMSGASADSGEMEAIMAEAEQLGIKAMRMGLPATAFAYFSTAGAEVETILADPLPLSSLKKVSVSGAYAQALVATGREKSAYQITRHLLLAARERVAGADAFAADSLLSWSNELDEVLEAFLAVAPVGEGQRFSPAIAQDVLFAVQFLQASGTSATLSELAARGVSASLGTPYRRYLDVVRQIDDLVAQLGEGGSTAELTPALDQLRSERQTLAQTIAQADPDFFRLGRMQFADAEALSAVLQQGEAIMTTYALGDGLVRVWVDEEGLYADRSAVGADGLAQMVTAFRQSIVGDGSSSVRADLAYELHETLVGSLLEGRAHIRHLTFVPNGVLDGLPLAALMTDRPAKDLLAGEELVDPALPWLVRRLDLAALPSMSGLVSLRSGIAPSRATRAFLGIGNPDYGYTDPVHGPLTSLPETEAEVRFIGALLGAQSSRDLLLREAATEANVRALPLDQYRILTFATHGFIAEGLTGATEPGLALSGSTLEETLFTRSDVMELELDADLVILSACSTASSDGTPGAEGLSGLASAFFYAGTRGLLVTHWDIPSGPALDVTTGMIEARSLDGAVSWPRALQNSILQMLDNPRSPLHAHPVSWAGHFLVSAQ